MKQVLTNLKNNFANDKKNALRTLLITEGFGFCFSLSFILGYQLDHYETVCGGIGRAILMLLLCIVLTQVVTFALMVFSFWLKEKERVDDKKHVSVKNWVLASLVLGVLWFIILLAYYPGVFSYDAEAQLYQIISDSYSTHHPLVHTLLMEMCTNIGFAVGNGMTTAMVLYAVLQLAMLALMCGFGVAEALRTGTDKRCVLVYLIFLGIFPVNGILAISTTKDVLFSGFVLIFTLFIRRIVCGETQKKNIYVAALSAILMMLFRNNAQYAFVVWLVVISLIALHGKKDQFGKDELQGKKVLHGWTKMILTMCGCFVVAIVCGAILKSSLSAESGSPREALSIPIQQMARVKVLHGGELSGELGNALNKLIDDEAASKYDAHLADPVKERISMKEPSLFVKTWIKLGIKYPGDYLDAWLFTTEGAWYICDKSVNRIYGEGVVTGFGYLSTDIRNMPDGFRLKYESKIPWLKSALESLVSDNSFEKVPVVRLIFAPALYVWAMFLYMYVQIEKRGKNGLYTMLFPCIYFLTLLLSPAILVRYIYPYMIIWIIYFMKENRSEEI